MTANWQGPAAFDVVLKAAAIGKEKQANRAERVRQERSEELQRLAAAIDSEFDKRKCRAQTIASWETHHGLIVKLTGQGKSTFEIAKALNDLGFYVDRKNVYVYQVKVGLKDKDNNPFDRSKR